MFTGRVVNVQGKIPANFTAIDHVNGNWPLAGVEDVFRDIEAVAIRREGLRVGRGESNGGGVGFRGRPGNGEG